LNQKFVKYFNQIKTLLVLVKIQNLNYLNYIKNVSLKLLKKIKKKFTLDNKKEGIAILKNLK